MNRYKSKSSLYVKVTTIGTTIISLFAATVLYLSNIQYGSLAAIFLLIIIIGSLLYYYTISVKEIVMEPDKIILLKGHGFTNINKSEIISVHRVEYSAIVFTNGSRGIFGFIGSTMDGSTSFVKDKTKMISIKISGKKYILSADNPDGLVKSIRELYLQE